MHIDGIEDLVEIGKGGFGTIYRGWQPLLRRPVAVKVISSPLATEEARDRFEIERKAMGLLSDHPNILTVYGWGEVQGGHPYILMEFAAGGSLQGLLEGTGPLAWQDAARWGAHVASALQFAHERDILHRDVKPANVLLSQYGVALLADFGVAKLAGQALTLKGMFTGSLLHAAPELLEGKAIPATDLYALGSTLHALLSGRAPFEGGPDDTHLQLLFRIAQQEPPELVGTDVPRSLAELVRSLLAKDPTQRPRTAHDVAEVLESLHKDHPSEVAAEPPRDVTAHIESRPQEPPLLLPSAPARRGDRPRPRQPAGFMPRPRLHEALDAAVQRRVVLIIAAPGFGKSSLLSAWAAERPHVWHGLNHSDQSLAVLGPGLVSAFGAAVPGVMESLNHILQAPAQVVDAPDAAEGFASRLCEALQRHLKEPLVLIIEDLHHLGREGPAARMLAQLIREAPSGITFVLSSREEPPFGLARLRSDGQVSELGPHDLAFDVSEVTAFGKAALPGFDPALGPALHRLTMGWPIAAQLALEALRALPPDRRAAALAAPDKPPPAMLSYLAEEVLAKEEPEVLWFLAHASTLDRFTIELCEHAIGGHVRQIITTLLHRGLFLSEDRGRRAWYSIHEPIRAFAAQRWPLEHGDRQRLLRTAAEWFERHDLVHEALQASMQAGDEDAVVRLLARHGEQRFSSGQIEAALAWLPEARRDGPLVPIVGGMLAMRGDLRGSLTYLQAAANLGPLVPATAWRLVATLVTLGRPHEAASVAAASQVESDDWESLAYLLGWAVLAHWQLGNADACADYARKSLEAAVSAGVGHCIALAHAAIAFAELNEGAWDAARAAADRSLEAALTSPLPTIVPHALGVRGLISQEAGDYHDALRDHDQIVEVGEQGAARLALLFAYTDRGHALLGLGRMEEAREDFEASISLSHMTGSGLFYNALTGRGDVDLARGNLALSRAAYERVLGEGVRNAGVEARAQATAQLARVLTGEDPAASWELAERAVAYPRVVGHARRVVSAGWVALALGDRGAAAARAASGSEVAAARNDRVAAAWATELAAMTADPPDVAALERAIELRRLSGAAHEDAATRLALATLRGDTREIANAHRALGLLGVGLPAAGATGLLAATKRRSRRGVHIRTLGGYRVTLHGMPLTAWETADARALLARLSAQVGTPVTVATITSDLWPASPHARTHDAVAALRRSLDPEQKHPPGWYLDGQDTLALAPDRTSVDVQDFLKQVRLAQASGRPYRRRLFREAELAYSGDYLQELGDVEWAAPLRKQSHDAYIAVLRELISTAVAERQTDRGLRYALRLLEHDPYDEDAHLASVRLLHESGRQREGRRRYRLYVAAMAKAGREPARLPASL